MEILKIKFVSISLICLLLAGCHKSGDDRQTDPAEIVTTSLTLNPGSANPLSAVLDITTDIPTTVTINIKGQDNNDLVHEFNNFSTKHHIPILGLYADYENTVEIALTTGSGVRTSFERKIKTDAIPVPTEQFSITTKDVSQMADGFIMLHLGATNGLAGVKNYNIMIDSYGKVRWYYQGGINHIFKQLHNGNFVVDGGGTITEINLLGIAQAYYLIARDVHHDLVETTDGNLLYLSSNEGSVDDAVCEIDRYSRQVIRTWDLRTILDKHRPVAPGNGLDLDWFHANGLAYDATDDSFLVSGRNQSAVVKIDRKSGQLLWIIGNHNNWADRFKSYLFAPQGGGFEWQWGQHAPSINTKDRNTILLFDNGSADRTTPIMLSAENNYSRAVEYTIDPISKIITQNWQWGKEQGSKYYSCYISNATYVGDDNVLICFGGILTTPDGNATDSFEASVRNGVRVVEVNRTTSKVVFELNIEPEPNSMNGFRSYRAYKISLY